MKYRIKISQLLTVVLLLIAKPFSWELFALGIGIAVIGEALRIWASGNLYKDKSLATDGPYRMVRNPLYLGSFLMAFGFAIGCINPAYPVRTIALILAVLLGFMFIYSAQIMAEEQHLRNIFGQPFEDYLKRVPPFAPKLSAFGEAIETNKFSMRQSVKNMEMTTVLGFVTIAVLIGLKLHFGK